MSDVAAFFDMDGTVVLGHTVSYYVRDLYRTGDISLLRVAELGSVLLRYKLSLIDMPRVMAGAVSRMRGQQEVEVAARCDRVFDEHIRDRVSEAAVEAIQGHRRRGHRVVLLTASTPYLAEPLARYLEVEDYLCTQLETAEGAFTGAMVSPPCFGAGKCHWALDYSASHGVDLGRSYFYTDSYSDLPMLQAVGRPRIVNPDPRLRLVASRRGWPVLWFER